MAKARSKAAGRRLPSVEKILEYIGLLTPSERTRLLDSLAQLPENRNVGSWLFARAFFEVVKENSRILGEKERQIENDLSMSLAELSDAEEAIEKYRLGPAARAKKRRQREILIRQYCSAGTTDPKRILDALRKDAPELADVSIKTIQNFLASR